MFNRALALTRKLGFPDVILPGEAAESSRGLWGQGRVGGPEAKQPGEMERGEGQRSGKQRVQRKDQREDGSLTERTGSGPVVRTVTCSYPVNDTTSPPILTALTVPPARPF